MCRCSQSTGAPGSSLQIKVRGTGTITAGTSPLYVVDGVPLAQEQLNTFNMNDGESIEVLERCFFGCHLRFAWFERCGTDYYQERAGRACYKRSL
ncbi:MAG: TonB-dependent receptor plug domain-containing protein [Bacteroides stercoris]